MFGLTPARVKPNLELWSRPSASSISKRAPMNASVAAFNRSRFSRVGRTQKLMSPV